MTNRRKVLKKLKKTYIKVLRNYALRHIEKAHKLEEKAMLLEFELKEDNSYDGNTGVASDDESNTDADTDLLRAKKKQIYEDLKDAVDRENDESYDQTALELCERCGWKTLVPDDGCLNCKRREWVGLTNKDLQHIFTQAHVNSCKSTGEVTYTELAKAVEAKLKEKNT